MYVKSRKVLGEIYNPFTNNYDLVYSLDESNVEYVPPKPVKRKINIYNKKAICCGNVVEIIGYEQPVFEGFENKAINKGKKVSKEEKRSNNINQSKMNLRRLINSNVTGNDLFITLTYKDNVIDIDVGKNDFKKFVKRWNYQRKKQGLESLKYVYVVEFQKRGAVHFHCIFFDVGYIKNKYLSELWSHGFVKVNKIDKVDNVGAYVVKYMQKDLIDNRLNNRDLYGRSKGNLEEPLIIKNPQEVAILEDSLKDVYSYQKTYDTDYYGHMSYKQYNMKREKGQL